MMKIQEESWLKIRSLAYAIDNSIQDINDSNCLQLENALMLSQMIIEEFERVGENNG